MQLPEVSAETASTRFAVSRAPGVQGVPSLPRRVLFVDHTAVLGGGELAMLALIRALDRSRFEPVVLLLSSGPLVSELEGVAETHVLPLPEAFLTTRRAALRGGGLPWRKALALSGYMLRLSSTIDRLRPRLIHNSSLKADILAGLVARYQRIPQVWHIRDRIDTEYLPLSAVRGFRALCRTLPNALIANSRSTLESLHAGHQRAEVISSGLDLRPFVELARGSETLAAALAAHHTIHIGMIGRISPWKGQEIFVEAAALVREVLPNVHFHVVGAPLFGEEDFEKSLRETTHALGLAAHVTFTGFRRDIPEIIAGLHIVVHASKIPEPFGQVIVQGMAAGKPVIATEGGGPSEIIQDGVTGFLVPRKDAHALAQAIIRLLGNPEHAQAAALRGQQHALRSYGSDATTRQVEALYDQLLSEDT